MRIGHYIPQVWVPPGRGRNVSGHIQVAARSAELARHVGHDITIISHDPPDGFERPEGLLDGLDVETVPDAWTRGGELGHVTDKASRINIVGLARQLRALRRTIRHRRFDVVHLHGRHGTVRLAALLALTRPGAPLIVSSIETAPATMSRVEKRLLAGVARILGPSDAVADSYARHGLPAERNRHGAVRDLIRDRPSSQSPSARHRVLFWREANHQNGGDTAVAAFDQLASAFPDVDFDLALRPFWKETPGVDELGDRHSNVTIHRFPYADGVSLESLVSEALVVVLPFRSLTMEPQMAVLESALAGAVVVTTDLGSSREIVDDPALLVAPGNPDALVERVTELLSPTNAPTELEARGRESAVAVAARWSWDGHAERLDSLYRSLATTD